MARRLCRTWGEGSPHTQVSPVCWEPSEACLVSGSQCPLPVPAGRFHSRSGTSWSWRGAAPSCCCVLQTPQCSVLGGSCHQHPTWSHCASTRGGGKPHPPAGFCQSKISPMDDLRGCLGAGWYSHSKWGWGLIPWEPFQLPERVSSALPLCSDSGAASRKGPLSHAVFCWKMS